MLAYLSPFWKRLVMPESCRDPAFDSFQMSRIAGSWNSIGLVMQMLMLKYSWRHLVVMSDQDSDLAVCRNGATTIINWLSTMKDRANDYTTVSLPMSNNPSDDEIAFYLNTIQRSTRGECTSVR